jgi:excisionase family DNA binding protein
MKATTLHSLPSRAAFSVAEVCAQTGIGRDSVYGAIRSGQLVARKLGRRMLITEKDLQRFLARLPKAGASHPLGLIESRLSKGEGKAA